MKSQHLPRLRPLAQAVSLGLCALTLPMAAQALSITTAAVSFNNAASVTDNEGGSATTRTNEPLGTSAISQFNASFGVLTGTTLTLTSTRTQTTQVTSTDGENTGNNGQVTSTGTGSSSAKIEAPGINQSFSTITQGAECKNNRQGACAGLATTSSAVTTNAALAALSDLDAYVGASTITVTRTAPTLSAEQQTNVFTGTESTTSTAKWTGTISATYEYLLHAAPSFDGNSPQLTLDLNVGTFYVGDTASLGFSIFNLLTGSNGLDRVGLDLDSISGSGNVGALTTDLATFLGLGAGSNKAFTAYLDTSTVGSFSAAYVLGLSDADVGARTSRWSYTMTLNLSGTVQERLPNGVPEPATLALLGAGLLGLGWRRKRS